MTSVVERKDATQGRVTLVVPAYNAEKFLAATLESVLGQDYDDLQVIVVDDGSTDRTAQILSSYADRVLVHRQDNAGQSAAMATGWNLGDGEILGYLSADDLLRPAAISRAVAALNARPEVVLVYPDFDLVDEQSRYQLTVRAPDFSRELLYADFHCLPGPGALMRRTAYEAVGPWRSDLRQMPDLEFYLRLGLRGDFQRIDEVLADYRVHPGSTTYSAQSYAYAEEPVCVANDLLAQEHLPADVQAWRRRTSSNAHLLSAIIHARAGRGGAALRHVLAIRMRPDRQSLNKIASVTLNLIRCWREMLPRRLSRMPASGR